jgi:hypothetical protein
MLRCKKRPPPVKKTSGSDPKYISRVIKKEYVLESAKTERNSVEQRIESV